jgi:hypothetical protein
MMSSAGQAINRFLLPVLQQVTGAIRHLSNSGIIKRASEALMKMFDPKTIGTGLVRMLAYIVVVVQNLPKLFMTAGRLIVSVFDYIMQGAKLIVGVFALIFGFKMVRGIIMLGSVLWEVYKAVRAIGVAAMLLKVLAEGAKGVLMVLAAVGAAVGAIKLMESQMGAKPDFSGAKDVMGDIAKDAEDLAKKMEGTQKKGVLGPHGSIGDMVRETFDNAIKGLMANSVNKQIASNTAKMVELQRQQLDINRMVLGGRELGRAGVSPIEMRGIRRDARASRRGRGGRSFKSMGDWLESLVDERVNQVLTERDRNRVR